MKYESHEINILILIKGEEKYIFLYTDNEKERCLETLKRFTLNKELSFSQYDADFLIDRINNISKKSANKKRDDKLEDLI